jgi:hypothetical protein
MMLTRFHYIQHGPTDGDDDVHTITGWDVLAEQTGLAVDELQWAIENFGRVDGTCPRNSGLLFTAILRICE